MTIAFAAIYGLAKWKSEFRERLSDDYKQYFEKQVSLSEELGIIKNIDQNQDKKLGKNGQS